LLLLKKAVCCAQIITHCIVFGIPHPVYAQTPPEGLESIAGKEIAEADNQKIVQSVPVKITDTTAIPAEAPVGTVGDPQPDKAKNTQSNKMPLALDSLRLKNGSDNLDHGQPADTSKAKTLIDNGYYYNNRYTASPATARGVASATTAIKKERKRFIDTLAPDTTGAAAVTVRDSLTEMKSTADASSRTDDLQLENRLSAKGKIAAALGTTALVGGIVASILYKKYNKSADKTSERIPQPPDPPGM
jgi:hypothetical protein